MKFNYKLLKKNIIGFVREVISLWWIAILVIFFFWFLGGFNPNAVTINQILQRALILFLVVIFGLVLIQLQG